MVAMVAMASLPSVLAAQTLPTSRLWHSDERTLLTDLSVVTAIAATRTTVFAATLGGLAVYDRGLRNWRETIGLLDGYPDRPVTAMAADPTDDSVWFAGNGYWWRYESFGRRLEQGLLSGVADQLVLDANDPSRGAYIHTNSGWYFVPRGALTAVPAGQLPAPGARIGSLSYQQLQSRLPAFDAIRFRLERDEQNRSYRLTSAGSAPLTNELFVGTDGNGAFKVDPVTYTVERLPAGMLGSAVGAVSAWRGQICAAGNARTATVRRGITCFDENLGPFIYYESEGAGGLPGTQVRAVLVTERAIWAATDQGLLRAPRRGGRIQQLVLRDGLPSNDVGALAAAADGVWAGTSGGLALVSDTGRLATVVARADGPPILSLASTDTDTLWAGTSNGLVAFLMPIGGPVVSFAGVPGLADPIVAIARRGDTLVAASASRLVIRAGAEWQLHDVPGRPIGSVTHVAADERNGFWVAGTLGLAYYDPSRGVWNALVSPGDVPMPVRDVAATRNYVWVATDVGVLRYQRRILMP
jgi:ligand-binding sensor domain-containing protein